MADFATRRGLLVGAAATALATVAKAVTAKPPQLPLTDLESDLIGEMLKMDRRSQAALLQFLLAMAPDGGRHG